VAHRRRSNAVPAVAGKRPRRLGAGLAVRLRCVPLLGAAPGGGFGQGGGDRLRTSPVAPDVVQVPPPLLLARPLAALPPPPPPPSRAPGRRWRRTPGCWVPARLNGRGPASS